MTGSVLLRLIIAYIGMGQAGQSSVGAERLAAVAVTCFAGCLLYARAGLPSVMLFNAVIDSRHLLRVIGWWQAD